MADQLPPPLLPADVDLRGNEWMSLYGDRLFNSETWIEAGFEGRCAALRLWWQAFAKEKPAASLPDNDKLLSVYAGYGEAVKVWLKIKPEAMRGWIKCSDGRLWHGVVAEVAAEAWERRQDSRETQEARNERQKRWRDHVRKVSAALRNAGIKPPRGASLETLQKMARDAGVDVTLTDVDVTTSSAEIAKRGQERKGQERKEDPAAASSTVAPRATSEAAASPVDALPDSHPPDLAAGIGSEPTPAGVSPPDPGPKEITDDLAIPPDLDRTPERAAFNAYQAAAKVFGWPPSVFMNSNTRFSLQARLAECGGLPGFTLALQKASVAKFLRTTDGKLQPWFDLDWMLDAKHFSRLMGDRYAERFGADRDGERTVTSGLAGLAEAGSG